MKYFFHLREETEVLTYPEPVTCPVWEKNEVCAGPHPCADFIMCDFSLSKMNGLQLFKNQSALGCNVPIQNRALLGGRLDQQLMNEVASLKCGFFMKPFNFNMIGTWVNKREPHLDLTQPVTVKRREDRYETDKKVTCLMPPNELLGRGIAVNMSASGYCIRTDFPLKFEQVITVHPDDKPYDARVLTVRWSRKIEDDKYLSGLHYWLA